MKNDPILLHTDSKKGFRHPDIRKGTLLQKALREKKISCMEKSFSVNDQDQSLMIRAICICLEINLFDLNAEKM